MRLTINPEAGETLAIETGAPEVGYVPTVARILVGFDAPGAVGSLELDHPEAVGLVNALMKAIHSHKQAKKAQAIAPAATLPIGAKVQAGSGPLSAKLARANA